MNPKEPMKGKPIEDILTACCNTLSRERAVLFSVVCNTYPSKAWKSRRPDTDDAHEITFAAGIETPDGPVMYHFDVDPYWDMFKVKVYDDAPEYDRPTPDAVIERIASLSNEANFKYGQLLISNQETELIRGISGERVKVPAGNRVVIGFDNLAHHLRDESIQPIGKRMLVRGYSHSGIVAVLWDRLRRELPMDEMLEDYEIEPKQVTDVMKEALEEIGIYGE